MCIEQKPKHNGKMETKLLYQQSGCDVKRTSPIRTTQNIVFEQSRNRWGGRVFISISLSLQLFSRFLGPFSSQLFSLTPLEIMSVDITLYVWGLILRETDTPAFLRRLFTVNTNQWLGFRFIVSSLPNAFYNICTRNIHVFSNQDCRLFNKYSMLRNAYANACMH